MDEKKVKDYDFTYGLRTAKLINIPQKSRIASFKDFKNFENYHIDILKGEGILLYGDAGTGKTYLSSAIARYYYVNMEIPIKFIDVPDFIIETKNFDSVKDYYEDLLLCKLIILDDLGSEYVTEFSTQQIGYLINKLYSNEISAIVTTNLLPKEIEDKYGARTWTRIDSMCKKKFQPTKIKRS